MTEQNPEDYEDVYPLLGAIGPYLSFTTGISNPVEPEDTDEDTTEPWEDEEN